ncbi:MAG: hypothetical protein UHU21_02850 [Lachnospiraceae bacterium]|nr:hypothetical protein [Lachnospiraceae bacterium]
MTVVHDITTKICNTCGREISILHPESWAYKRKLGNVNIFWCSWSCLREAEKEGKFSMKKLTLDNKKHAVKIAMDGGNPLEYIRMCGISNAADCWSKIKADLKEKDPEAWEKLPKRLPNPVMDRNKEAPADAVTKAALQHPERPIVAPVSPVVMETPEQKQKITKPLAYDGYTVCCIESKTFGRFYWDRDHNHLDWTTGEGEEVSFTPQGWKMFLEELPKAAAILGVEL